MDLNLKVDFPNLKRLLVMLVMAGFMSTTATATMATSCSSEDGTSVCECNAGERCVSTQRNCYCESARRASPGDQALNGTHATDCTAKDNATMSDEVDAIPPRSANQKG